MSNLQKRMKTLEDMFGVEYLGKLFKHIEDSYDAIHRLQGGQLSEFVEHLKEEKERTQDFSSYCSLANDTLGYDCIRVMAVLTHHCQLCAENKDAWHTRSGFCEHK